MNEMNFTSWLGHGFSGAAILGTLLGWFPHVAALVAIIWYAIQIYESATVQTWFHTRRLRRIAKLKKAMARLEAQEKVGLARKERKANDDV